MTDKANLGEPRFLFTDAASMPWRASVYAEGVEVKDLGTANGRLSFSGLRLDARALAGGSGERLVSFSRESLRTVTRLVPRAAVDDGPIAGPAIIESYDTTVVVPPNCSARAAGSGCIAIDMGTNDE